MSLPRAVKDRIGGIIWAGAWLWPLIAPAVGCIEGNVPYPVLGGVGLLAFVVLYLIIVTNAFDEDRLRRRGRLHAVDLVLVGALAAIGLSLFIGYRDDPYGWWNIMLYVAVVGAATFTPKIAGSWTLSVVGVTVSCVLGARGPDGATAGDVAEIAFGTLMASALVFVVKQMLRYIRVLRDTRAELAQNAVAEERLRFARDLHDLLGHTMSVIVVKAEVVRRLVEREPALAAEAAADIEEIGRRALTEVREAVNGYRAPEFAVELDSVRAALADAGISVRVRHDGPQVPPAASQVFGWVIREAATNVIRHSGAKICEVTVTVDSTTATLEVRDTGYGHRHIAPGSGDGARTGVGLVGLRERVTAAGGTLATGNASRGGFRVLVTMPAIPAPSCVAGPDPSMWAVLDPAQRSDRAALQPEVSDVSATAAGSATAATAIDRLSDADGSGTPVVGTPVVGTPVEAGIDPAAVAPPSAPAQPTPAAGSMVSAVRGKSS